MTALSRLVRAALHLVGLARPTPIAVTSAASASRTRVMFVPGLDRVGAPSLRHMREHGVDVTDYLATKPVLDTTVSPVDGTPDGFVWCDGCGLHHAIKRAGDRASLCPSCRPHQFKSWTDRR